MTIELTEAADIRACKWIEATCREGVRHGRVLSEILDRFEDAASTGQDYVYELGGQYTRSGRPEIFTLEADDVIVTTHPED